MTDEIKIFNKKASMAILDDLHCKVAEHLANNLEDPKVLTSAIKFLKDNDITADVIESSDVLSLTDSIKAIANNTTAEDGKSYSVEDMLKITS